MALVVSYDTYVGIAMETSATSPYREGATSTDPADYGAASPTAFLPLSGEESMNTALNFVEIPQPEMAVYHSKFQSLAKRVEGGIPLMVPPGLLGGASDYSPADTFKLKSWVYDRNSSGTTGVSAAYQCLSATVWVRIGDFCKRFVGVKVATADFQVSKGQPLVVNLGTTGFGEHVPGSVPAFSAPAWWGYAVYGGDGCSLSLGDEDYTSVAESMNVDSVGFTINNKLDDDPHRIWNSPYPRRYYNRDREVTGTMESDFLSSAIYEKFLGSSRGTLQLDLSRRIGGTYNTSTGGVTGGTVYSASISFPKIRYETNSGINAGGPKDRIVKQNYSWRADGSVETGNLYPEEIYWA